MDFVNGFAIGFGVGVFTCFASMTFVAILLYRSEKGKPDQMSYLGTTKLMNGEDIPLENSPNPASVPLKKGNKRTMWGDN